MRVDGYKNLQNSPARDTKAQPGGADKAGQAAAADAVNAESVVDSPEEEVNTADSVEISADAQQLLAAGNSGDVRPEKVDRARKVLESGSYNDRGVIEKTAERIADRFSAEG